MTNAEITSDAGAIRVSGELTFSTIPSLFEQGKDMLLQASQPVIDLAGVSRANSAGLLLLLEWLSEGRKHQQQVRFKHIPDTIKSIAKVSNVLELLPEVSEESDATSPPKPGDHAHRPQAKTSRRRKKR